MSTIYGQIQIEADVLHSITRDSNPTAFSILAHASRLMQLATELAEQENQQGLGNSAAVVFGFGRTLTEQA